MKKNININIVFTVATFISSIAFGRDAIMKLNQAINTDFTKVANQIDPTQSEGKKSRACLLLIKSAWLRTGQKMAKDAGLDELMEELDKDASRSETELRLMSGGEAANKTLIQTVKDEVKRQTNNGRLSCGSKEDINKLIKNETVANRLEEMNFCISSEFLDNTGK